MRSNAARGGMSNTAASGASISKAVDSWADMIGKCTLSPVPTNPCVITIRITAELKQEDFLDAVDAYTDQGGGTCRFVGHTRAEHHPTYGRLLSLDYESHETLARRLLRHSAEEAARTAELCRIVILHALGSVAPGRPSVLVSVTAPHRGEAFTACRNLIDRLKQDAPIWKREIWEHGATWSEGSPVTTGAEQSP